MKFRKIAFALFLSIFSFIGYSQVNVTTNFNIIANKPVDTRLTVVDLTTRDNLAWRYEGMLVYVLNNQTNYQLRGGILNTNWIAISTSAYSAGTGLIQSGNTFSHDLHTGDVIGVTSLTIAAIQGRTLATASPSNGDVLTWDNTASTWKPAQTTNSGLYNGNRVVKRTSWPVSINMGTTTNVSAFLDAVFFPFLSATISINADELYEVGTSNSITISGSTTVRDETIFSNGRVDQTVPSTSTIYTFGASTTYNTTTTFTPIQSTPSSLNRSFIAYQTVGNNGTPITINSSTKSVQSCYPFLHGVSSMNLTSGGTATYSGLSGKLIATKSNKTVSLTGTSGYIYFCYPASYGPLTGILDHSSFQQLSSFTRYSVNVTSVGLVNNWNTLYYIYKLNGTTSPSGWNYQFLF